MSNATGGGTNAWLTSAAVVAACALIFTVASFWWINARRGRLKSFEPHTFAAVLPPPNMRLRLPLVLYNTGALPIIVQNLRIRFLDVHDSVPLPWMITRSQIKPAPDDDHAFAAVFYVPGRSAQQIFVEFGADSLGFELEKRDYPVRIEAKLGHKQKWKPLLDFTLRAGKVKHPSNFITYSNAPDS